METKNDTPVFCIADDTVIGYKRSSVNNRGAFRNVLALDDRLGRAEDMGFLPWMNLQEANTKTPGEAGPDLVLYNPCRGRMAFASGATSTAEV